MTSEANKNGEKTRDIELNIDEKRPLQSSRKQPSKMPSLRHFLFTIFAICLLTIGICSASNARVPRSPTHRDKAKFQDLLESVQPASLHDILHEHMDKYKHGVFQEDKDAVAAVHQETPEVASSLVELAKRQAGPSGNSSVVTSSTAVTTESTSTVVSSITSSTIVTQSSDSSSTPATQESTSDTTTPPITSGTSSGLSSSHVVTPTTTPPSTSKGSPTDFSSPAIATSALSSSGSNSHIDSSEPQSSPSSTSQSVTSLQIYTTTLPNGKASTVTQTTVVPAGQPDQTGAAGQSSKTGPAASLQTNGGSTKKIGTGVAMGMVVMAVLVAS